MDPEKRTLANRSNRLLEELRHMRDVEKRKREEPISSPKFHALADEVDKSSREVFRLARDQERLGDQIPTGSDTIDDVDRRDDASATSN
jgi:hypothetical protein